MKLCYTDSAKFLHSRESAACASISQNPYFFLLASALLRSFASRIESETTRFNRNPYYPPLHFPALAWPIKAGWNATRLTSMN
ncbi:hypothetical protein DVJ83_08525 [Deinococcus wulumuqiensis]|uniref:Uncharacterized protein n=1 Tax=Deinococcus wulumuqiensis TaxID=980427 RepID=A0A345IHM3_9DEIO|nr:hypothetical protein DVJ83_08525 [Deinococcus wulumuqiensis]